MLEYLLPALGWTLVAMALVIVLPQLHRLLTTGTHAGFSLRSAALAATSCLAWVAYTWVEGDVPALFSSLLPLFVWLACGGLVAVRRGYVWRFVGATAFLAAVTVLAGATTGGYHVLAVLGSLVWLLPQARTVLRSDRLDAVSAPTYALLFVENIGWIVYAIGTGRLPYMIAPLVQAPLAAIVVSRTRARGVGRIRRGEHRPALDGALERQPDVPEEMAHLV